MKAIIKRTLSFVLVMVMTISLLPMSAFALDGKAFTMSAETVKVDGTADQTVNVALAANSDVTVTTIQGTFSEASDYISLSGYEFPVTLSGTNGFNTTTGELVYVDDSNFTGFSVVSGGNVVVAKYTVDKNTPSGEYEVQFDLASVAGEDLEPTSEHSYYTAKIVVTNTSGEDSTSGYTATIAGASTNGNPVRVGQTLAVEVGANTAFQATEMTITYDSSLVSFTDPVEGDALYGKVVDDNNGTLKIADYGAEKTGKYTLSFVANATGTANFKFTSAGFGTGTSAEDKNLTEATLPGALTITIEKAQYNVTIDSTLFNGASTVLDGEAYTFTATDSSNYTYDNVKATINNTEVTVNGDAANGWSIAAGVIHGDVTITATRNAKTYTFTATGTLEGDSVTTSQTPTYDEDFKFTLPAGKAIDGIKDGYHYQIVSVKVGETTLAAGDYSYDASTRTATIPGSKINGNIVVTVESVTDSANTVTITISGENVAVQGYDTTPVTIVNGTEITLVLTPEAGYTYSVTIGDGTEVVLSNDKTTYTFTPTTDVTVNVNKTLTITEATATEYVQLDGYVAWLVQLKNTKLDGKVYSFNGSEMYWSEQYGAYVTVVIAETAPDVTIGFTIADGTTKEVAYDMDVNGTGKVDANDAQLAYNIYQTGYSAFTQTVTVDKFLEADVNHDKVVDTKDAAAIVSAILDGTAT